LTTFDESYFQAEEHLLWPQSCWYVVRGQEDQLRSVFLNERDQTALHREVSRRYLQSCRTACPNCLESGAVAFADRPLLDRRLTAQALRQLRGPTEVNVTPAHDVESLVQHVRDTFRRGEPRCYLIFELAQQSVVNATIARLGDEGLRLEVGQHSVAIATSNLRSLGLPGRKPQYEIGLELGDPR